MIKPNWDEFKAKFSDNPQYHLEWFCYLLFCKENNQPHGIFRYKNQSAIETDPIDTINHCLGFQSKFYDTTLSSNKAELIHTLEKARRDYPKLTKLYLYTNQEWVQAYPKKSNPTQKAQKSAAQQEIEDKATKLGINLVWRTASYFESPFVCQTCADLSKYFFVRDNSIYDLISFHERHTESILKDIKQSIPFNGNEISIERSNVLSSLKDPSFKVSIVSGKGGVGKTVEVKKFYQDSKGVLPVFAFKANEFEVERLDDVIRGRSITDFLTLFGDSSDKVIIIDSSEKLMDLNNQEPFKEFIDLSVEHGWRIIFTTRDHYFDDLNHLCLDVLGVIPNKLYVSDLTERELEKLSEEFTFVLPANSRLRGLLQLPFYLSAYLRFYDANIEESMDLAGFKHYLWNKRIKAGDTKREKLFCELALQRANSGKFYLLVETNNIGTAEALLSDEVLGVKDTSFFISHDIYEEWALEKFIGISFSNRLSTTDFFSCLGQSLPIRRSFRLWISEQLFLNTHEIKIFIESAIDDEVIGSIWKDEIITAILLSDYSSTFFDIFSPEILRNNLELLHRVSFILRIACKEIDNSILTLLGLKQSDITYFTKPKGEGWSAFISFLFENREKIGLENLRAYIPVLSEWNGSVKQGETTRKSSLLCLEYYKWLESEDSYLNRGKFLDSILKTIANGASEIKSELALLIDEICISTENGKTSYEHLAKLILKEFDGISIAQALPAKTLELASACWLKPQASEKWSRHKESEHMFGVVDDYDFNYHPESALQTPIFMLLRSDLKATVDFILSFINRTTLNLVNYCGEENFKVHELTIGDKTTGIFLDQSLWGAYRGVANVPNLIQSILMALEKFFLENAIHFKEDNLEAWLNYILKNTNSSALCSVVASIVLANKDRLFNVAKILIEVKDFIQFDTARLIFDSQLKGQLETVAKMTGGIQHSKIYHNERVKACEAEHRKSSLESICLYYQFFGKQGVVDEIEVQRRQIEIWKTLDKHYIEIEPDKDSEASKLWRMSLARMDSRKMDIETKLVEDKIAINFNPRLEEDLKNLSDSHQEKQQQDYRFMALSLWARNKLDNKNDCKKYEQYELNPHQALSDLQALFEKLTDENVPPSEGFIILNRATHLYTSAALLKFHQSELDEDGVKFCLSIVENNLKQVFDTSYQYQIGDGMDSCFQVIPDLFLHVPENIYFYKIILIAGLMRFDSISVMGAQRFSAFAIMAIVQLWKNFDEDVQAIFWGYLTLYPRYTALLEAIRQESFEENSFSQPDFPDVWIRLFEENEDILSSIEDNDISRLSKLDCSKADLHTKSVAIYLIPNDTREWALSTVKWIVETSVDDIFSDDRSYSNNYQSWHDFLKKFAIYILSVETLMIEDILKPFIEKFNSSKGVSKFLEEIVLSQDAQQSNENFWIIWNLLKPKVVELVQANHIRHTSDEIIKNYLLALPWWKADAKDWHALTDNNARFFKEMAENLYKSKSTLYSFAMLLSGIGSRYLPYGVFWLSKIIKMNTELSSQNLDGDTIYYLNAYMRKYLYRERINVRRSPELMSNVLVILDFLIEQGEVSGYLMRESIV